MSENPWKDKLFDATDVDAVNAIRMLCADMVQQANSGHPGGPMSLSDFVYVLWTRFLRHDPADPEWPDRDRFVLSGGHVSSLQYALLGLFGYLPEDEWKNFRQLHSLTPGHVERELPGAETTTGPLGQGFANAVGMAIAEQVLRAELGKDVVGHRTFVTLGDGDIQEGISSEAGAVAGHLRLGRLIAFFDDNHAQIDGDTNLVTSEDVGGRFIALGWQVLYVDGHDHDQIADALRAAVANTSRPTLIVGRTLIAKGTATREGDYKTHGAPLGDDEIRQTKERYGLPDERFYVPDAVRQRIAAAREALVGQGAAWRAAIGQRDDAEALVHRLSGQPRPSLPAGLPSFTPDDGPVATRKASGAFLGAVAETSKSLIGGAADLGSSVKTFPFQPVGDHQATTPAGRLIHWGVRELTMAAASGGIAAHGGFVPFTGTFLVFADYMKPAIRLAALMQLRVVYIFTHDSFYVGEDGPTHQPMDQLAMLRAIPGLTVIRPSDANETVAAWRWSLSEATGPVALVLTRQGLPVADPPAASGASAAERGARVVSGGEHDPPDVVLVGSGSEVSLAVDAAALLTERGRRVRVVDMASWQRFEAQPAAYREEVLPTGAPVRLAVEAAASLGWERYAGPLGAVYGFDRFGLSAPAGVLREFFGFTAEAVAERAEALIAEAPVRLAALNAALPTS